MISQYVKGRAYVFIDAANLELSVKHLGWWIKYKKFYDYFEKETNLKKVLYYCVRHDTDSQNRFFTFLKKTGFKLVTKPLKTIISKEDGSHKRKANFDVEIALDAYIARDDYDTLILFSGDSDFKYLIDLLKAKNKRIVVISSRYHVARELVETASKYIDIKKLKPFIKREDKK